MAGAPGRQAPRPAPMPVPPEPVFDRTTLSLLAFVASEQATGRYARSSAPALP
jgi:hypothetical protein